MTFTPHKTNSTIQVWDPLVRVGHWTLAIAFATAYLTEGEPGWLHSWAGYITAGTVCVRIFWGLVGSHHARFSNFITSPMKAFGYLRNLVSGQAKPYIGHSPAGGLMTILLLFLLTITAISGMGVLAEEKGYGPLAGIVAQKPEKEAVRNNGDKDDVRHERRHHDHTSWEKAHDIAANLTFLFVLIHVVFVALISVMRRENLARAMVTGKKRSQ